MAIRYKKLFKLLIDRDLKKKDLRDMTGISYATLQKLERGENVMTEVLNTICLALHCKIEDVAEVVPDEQDAEKAPEANAQQLAGGQAKV